MNLEQQLQTGWSHHQRGQWSEAENIYRQILAQHPNHAGTMHLLGTLSAQTGRYPAAIDLIRRAIVICPDRPAYYINLGAALTNTGQFNEAIATFRQAIALKADNAVAHGNLGNALKEMGLLPEAVAACRQAIALQPDFAEAHSNLSGALGAMGKTDEAIAAARQAIALKPEMCGAFINLGNAMLDRRQFGDAADAYRQAIRLAPNLALAHSNLGTALAELGHAEESEAACRKAISLNPELAEAHNNLGNALRDQARLDEAVAEYQQAIQLKPRFAEAFGNLGIALRDKGQADYSLACHRQSVQLKPDYAQGHTLLGIALKAMGHLDQAVAAQREAIRHAPQSAEAHSNLGSVLNDLGQLDEAIVCYRRSIELNSQLPVAGSNLLFTMIHHPTMDARSVAAEHRAWADRHAPPAVEAIAHGNDSTPDRPLRIGYVSPDFRRHSVGYFFLSLLEHRDRRGQVFCYANVRSPDDFTERMRCCADGWRSIVGRTNAAAADMVRADRIDILVDLSGHTAENRVLIFAHKPAPVQVTYLGYANTTGMAAMDYRLTDALADPPGVNDELNIEKLWRLPRCAWCYQSPMETPAVQPRGDGPIVFGCFNAFAKVNAPLLAIWAQVLKAVPGSRLLLKSAGAAEESSRRRLIGQLADLGISGDRIDIFGWTRDIREHFAFYGRADISLDTFPYHGTTTTCESLWMGVPVVCLAGAAHVSRVGVSLLTNAGIPEWIAQTPAEYVQTAVALAGDLPRLAELRRTLRQKMQDSALMDAPRFAGDVTAAYRRMWRKWCQSRSG